jgi:hypothetical protein
MALGSGKQNKTRRWTGGGPRPDLNAAKRSEAVERNEAWAGLSSQKQIAELDRRLGKGVGARKQRARLARAAKAA